MRVHRGSLFWGLFFLLLGGIPLADRAGLIDAGTLEPLGRLWPLAIIGIGVAILVSRTQFATLGTVVAAGLLGGLAGLALASGGTIVASGDCSPGGGLTTLNQSGTLDQGGTVVLELACGELNVSAATGNSWALAAGYRGSAPAVSPSGGRLEVRTPRNPQRQEWQVTVPRDQVTTLEAAVNAGTGRLDLGGMKLSRLRLDVNAGDIVLLASGTTIDQLDANANAGRLRLTLGGATRGRVTTNVGGLDLCVPTDARLEFVLQEQNLSGTNLGDRGLSRSGSTWTRSGTGPLIHLEVSGNLSGLTLDPTGGCR